MPVRVRWDDEAKTIAIYELVGGCTLEDMNNAQRELDALIKSVSHNIGIIMDWREAGDVFQRMVEVTGANVVFASTIDDARKIIAEQLSDKPEE